MIEISLISPVESFTIDSVYRIRSFLRNSQACMCVIENNIFQWRPIGSSESLRRVISGEKMSLLDNGDILNMYRSKRLLVLGQLDDQQPVVVDNEFSSFIKREINKRPFATRKFKIADCDLKTNKNQSFNGKSMFQTFDKNTNENMDRLISCLPLTDNRSLSPRSEHSTKVSLTSYEAPLVLYAYPHHKNISNTGLTRSSEDNGNCSKGRDKLSIPVTDGSGPASHEVATNGQSRYKSIINNVIDSDGGANRRSTSYGSYTPSTSSYINGHTPISRQGFAPSTGNYTTTNPPRHPDYANFNHRKLSFGGWPLSGKPDPTTLANWGFFATGAQDLVRCYHCGIGLKDWIADDDVMTEHIKHSCDCPFLLRELGQEQLQRLKIAVLYPETNNQDTISTTTPPQVTLPYKIRHPRYQTMEARISSYDKFPSHVSQTKQQCAVAGLFFTGEKDICRCFTCDGGLQRWDPADDPIIEHAKYFPTCDYIKQLKGDNYIQQVQMAFKASQQGATGGPSDQVNVMKSTATDELSFKMNEMSIQATSTVDTNKPRDYMELLRTDVAKPALDMGYSKKDVSCAIKQMRNNGQTNFTAEELVNYLLDNMDSFHLNANASEVNKNANNNNTDTEYLAAENERLKSLTTCMLCLTGETNILCLPCTHHKTCHECSKALTHCPACGKYIQEKIRTYMA